MGKLRKGCCYRKIEPAYTRKSKRREKSYVRGVPYSKIVTFDMGNLQAKFDYDVQLVSKDDAQIRHNALESARVAVNKIVSTRLGEQNYRMKIRTYPHHILRENPIAMGAGADRYSTGMAHSFGKPIGLAAQIHKGQVVFDIFVNEKNLEIAKKAINQARYKFSIRAQILVKKLN
jgi:large subunit ribosomal protein L10e